MIPKNNVNISLLHEELSKIPGSVWYDEYGKKHALFGIIESEDGYTVFGLSKQVVDDIVNLHDKNKLSEAEIMLIEKEKNKKNVLSKLKITEEELKLLVD